MTSGMSQGCSPSIERLCRLAGVSRAGYYRFWRSNAPRAHDTAVRDQIQRLALANGRHRGYRLVTFQLRQEGLVVNHKRVLRLMRQDNLLCLRKRPFVPPTTDSRHGWPVVPNLARGMQPNDLDQLWVADITPTSVCSSSSPIWRSSSMPSAAASSAGRWPITCRRAWRSTPSGWPSRPAGPRPAA